MARKNLQEYLEKRLTKAELAAIDREAAREKQAFENLQRDVVNAVNKYVEKENIGFNELVRRLDVSPTHLAKIRRGEANLTISSMARIFALLEQTPHLVFTQKK